MKETTTVL